jgi:hypothetical protein
MSIFLLCRAFLAVFDDLRTHHLTGNSPLSPETRQVVLRIIVFLYTDQEYTYSVSYMSLFGCLFRMLNVVSIGLSGKFFPPMIDYYSRHKALQNGHSNPTPDIPSPGAEHYRD